MLDPRPEGLVVLLLSLFGAAGSENQATTHSMRYDFVALSQPSPGQAPYEFSGYLDDQSFLWCCKMGRWAEPWAPWARPKNPDAWEKLILRLKARAQYLVIILRSIMEQRSQSQESHTLQATVICELRGNQSSWGHWRYSYDGQDFLLSTLESFNSSKSNPGQGRTAEGETAKEQSFLSKSCFYPLRKYLEAGAGLRSEIAVIEPSSSKQLPLWILCGLAASAVVAVGAVGTFLWRKWKQGRMAGAQRDIYIPMSNYSQTPDSSI